MNAKQVKAQIHNSAEKIESGVEVAAAGLSNGAEALGRQGEELHDRLRDLGQRLSESTKSLTDEAARQARLRPLATFAIALVAGIVVARSLRR
ncbi:MAG: hypothetical protein WBV39_04720 [Rudaea sp.]